MNKSTFIFALIIFAAAFLWYENNKEYPVEYGVNFNSEYATSLGLNWQKNYLAILDELKVKYLRLTASWSVVESEQGKYDFSNLDWQIKEAQKRGVKVVLTFGQKTPRWPECHIPSWANKLAKADYIKALLDYDKKVVERYKENKALEMWQVENEPYINFNFGECGGFQVEAVQAEVDLVRSLDSTHKILITDSGELGSWWKASRLGDVFGTTLYRVVTLSSGKVFTYDWMPAITYKVKGLIMAKNWSEAIVAELQAEPWAYPGNSTVAEQEKTISSERLQSNIDYAKHVGVKRVYLWGAEWWYWMKEVKGNSQYWDIVKNIM